MSDAVPGPIPAPTAVAVSTVVACLQGVLVLTWTLYALMLPALADRAGMPRSWLVWLLLADQLLFACGDWAAGLYADRLRRTLRRVAPLVLASAMASALVLGLLPVVAWLGVPSLLAAAALTWALCSAMLRAPVYALLGRLGGPRRMPLAVNGALVGVALASAVGPLLTRVLQGVDPRWPIVLASLALLAASLPVLRLDPPPSAVPRPPPVGTRRAAAGLAGAMLCAAFAVQVYTVLLPPQLPAADGWRIAWAPLFWAGFAIGLAVGGLPARSRMPARWDTVAFSVGAVALWLAPLADGAALRAAALVTAGGCWALVFSGGMATVLRHGRDGGLATPLGIFVSCLALATAARLLLSATGWASLLSPADVALASWIGGGAGVLAARSAWPRAAAA